MPTTLYGYGKVIQTGKAEPVQVESAPVSHDFFRVPGVSPMLGRDFSGSDEQPGAAPVVVLSNGVWREHLGADRNIIGQVIRLNGQGHTVIGVMRDLQSILLSTEFAGSEIPPFHSSSSTWPAISSG